MSAREPHAATTSLLEDYLAVQQFVNRSLHDGDIRAGLSTEAAAAAGCRACQAELALDRLWKALDV